MGKDACREAHANVREVNVLAVYGPPLRVGVCAFGAAGNPGSPHRRAWVFAELEIAPVDLELRASLREGIAPSSMMIGRISAVLRRRLTLSIQTKDWLVGT